MDIEAVKAFLESEEGKSLVAPMIESAKQPLLAKRDELLAEKDAWRKKIESYEALGDYETLSKALKQKTPAESEKVVDNDLLETLRKQLAEKDANLKQFKNNLIKSRTESAIEESILRAKGNPKLLKGVVSERVKSSMDDEGNVVFEVVDGEGRKIYRSDESNGTIDDVIAELKKDADYGMAFASSGASGSGTRQGAKATAEKTRTQMMLDAVKSGKY